MTQLRQVGAVTVPRDHRQVRSAAKYLSELQQVAAFGLNVIGPPEAILLAARVHHARASQPDMRVVLKIDRDETTLELKRLAEQNRGTRCVCVGVALPPFDLRGRYVLALDSERELIASGSAVEVAARL